MKGEMNETFIVWATTIVLSTIIVWLTIIGESIGAESMLCPAT